MKLLFGFLSTWILVFVAAQAKKELKMSRELAVKSLQTNSARIRVTFAH